ncbi:hypothetical protein STPH1_3266 [Streptomyces sp. OM5714]|nr:hypothetical protein STPH1_3266 [Streptomyces sp. OM5714]
MFAVARGSRRVRSVQSVRSVRSGLFGRSSRFGRSGLFGRFGRVRPARSCPVVCRGAHRSSRGPAAPRFATVRRTGIRPRTGGRHHASGKQIRPENSTRPERMAITVQRSRKSCGSWSKAVDNSVVVNIDSLEPVSRDRPRSIPRTTPAEQCVNYSA